MTPKDSARARLAGTNLVGVVDDRASKTRSADVKKVYERLVPLLTDPYLLKWHSWGGPTKGVTAVEYWFDQCVLVLQQAPLTINLEPFKFFGNKVAGDKVQSIWNRLRSKGPGYADVREGAENLMFGYDDDSATVGGVKVGTDIKKYGGTAGLGADGQPRSNTFVADLRPKYAGVNFSWAVCGRPAPMACRTLS